MTIVACPPSTPVSRGVVEFVPATFKTAFPEFATVADAALVVNFSFAQLQLDNSCRSRVCNAAERETLLNLLTAHITQLRNGANGQPPSGLVGFLNRAAEGSVSVGSEVGTIVYGQAYYLQTQYGFLYWQSTAKYRTAVYVPAPVVCADLAGAGPFNSDGFVGGGWPGNEPGCGC